MKVYTQSIDVLNLSYRSHNCLIKERYKYKIASFKLWFRNLVKIKNLNY